MLIIFGIRRRRKEPPASSCCCPALPASLCSRRRAALGVFALFFVPVVPLGTKYFTVCSLCAASTRIDEVQAQRLEQAAAQQASQAVQMTPDGPLSPMGSPPVPAPLPAPPPFSPSAPQAPPPPPPFFPSAPPPPPPPPPA